MKTSEKNFIPVMLTPFDESGEIDYNTLTQLTQFYLKAGAKGLFANCLSGEMYELSNKERLNIIQHIVHEVNGAVPVVATGNFGSTITAQADLVKRVYEKGVHAVILVTGLLANEDEPSCVFEERMYQLLDMTDKIPIGFYECPVPYKRVLTPEQLKHFVSTERVRYHKDTSLDIENIRGKLAAADDTDFGLYDAYMGHAVTSLSAGAAGLSCIQGNFFPELIVWLCRNYNNSSKAKEVKEVQQFFIDNMKVMHYVYPVTAKYFLQKRGFHISAFTRRQVGIYSTEVENELEQLYIQCNTLREKLGIQLVSGKL